MHTASDAPLGWTEHVGRACKGGSLIYSYDDMKVIYSQSLLLAGGTTLRWNEAYRCWNSPFFGGASEAFSRGTKDEKLEK